MMSKFTFSTLLVLNIVLIVGNIYFHIVQNPSISEVLGTDSNNNGVRDDVEDYINKNYFDKNEQKALLQFAKRVQLQMASFKDPEESNRLRVNGGYIDCAEYVFGGIEKAYDEIKKTQRIILNTPKRQAAYDKYNRNLKGGVPSLGKSPSAESCEFNLTTK